MYIVTLAGLRCRTSGQLLAAVCDVPYVFSGRGRAVEDERGGVNGTVVERRRSRPATTNIAK